MSCGNLNPIISLFSKISNSAFQDPIELASQIQNVSPDEMPLKTYQMDELINEISNVDIQPTGSYLPLKKNAVNNWLSEYSNAEFSNAEYSDEYSNTEYVDKYSNAYFDSCQLSENYNLLNSVWDSATYLLNDNSSNSFGLADFESISNIDNSFIDKTPSDLQLVAKDFLHTIDDSLFSNSKFFCFLHDISKDVSINELIDDQTIPLSNFNGVVESQIVAQKWAEEFNNQELNLNKKSLNILANSNTLIFENDHPLKKIPRLSDNFITQQLNEKFLTSSALVMKNTDDTKIEFWKNLEAHWKDVAGPDLENNGNWLLDIDKFNSDNLYKEYSFSFNNDHCTEVSKSFEDCVSIFEKGNFIEAVLLLEATLKYQPLNSKAWLLLGEAQAALENDRQAIAALKNCCNIDAKVTEALLLLAVSYMNESMYSNCCQMLNKYLCLNDEYSEYVSTSQPLATGFQFSIVDRQFLQDLIESYLKAIQSKANNIDANLQIGLGVLYRIAGDYSKSVDCFKTALQINTKDWSTWNKLGAVLSLSHRHEEAIDCFRNTLSLASGCLRARHNIAISCVNLHAFQEAMQHFLSVVTVQEQLGSNNAASIIPQGNSNIWDLIKSTLVFLNRNDLIKYCDDRDTSYLNSIFT